MISTGETTPAWSASLSSPPSTRPSPTSATCTLLWRRRAGCLSGLVYLTVILSFLHLPFSRYHIKEERKIEGDDDLKNEMKRRRCARKPTKVKKGRSQDHFACAHCAFVPESKTQEAMYTHYVTCLPDFIRHLHAFFPTFLYPSHPEFPCPLCEKKFSARRRLEVHLGVDHRRVEAYLPKTKVISTKERLVVEQEAKEDNSEAKEVEKVEDLRTSEEKEDEKVEGNAIEIETTETIKSGRATGNEAQVNSEEQDIGVNELDQVCSQIVLETADDSTDESDEEEEDFVRGEENPGKDGKEADIGEDAIDRMQMCSDVDESDENFSDEEDLAVIEIKANISEELLSERNEAVKEVQSLDDLTKGSKLRSKNKGNKETCSSIVDKMRRKRKLRKSKGTETKKISSPKYCFCQRPYQRSDGPMVGCDGGCSQWFHFSCLGLPTDHKMPPGPWNCEACKLEG